MTIARVPVTLGDRSYEVVIGKHLLTELRDFVESERPTSIVLVTDRNVGRHHTDALQNVLIANTVVEVPPGEASKSLIQLGEIYDQCLAMRRLDRNSMVVGLGGGMIGDLAGFAAATLLRGIRHVHVPTSLLAMVDSSVGGKTAINHPSGKNLIGAFHQPVGVFCDLEMLDTLPLREYVSALAEIVKTAVLAGEEFLSLVEGSAQQLLDRDPDTLRMVVERCVRFKAEVVAEDEREISGRRATLNLGHTLAHVIETAFPGEHLHGEAVSIGLNAALRLSFARADLDQDVAMRVHSLLMKLGLPVDVPKTLERKRMLEVMASDKKRHGEVVRFVVISELGAAGTLPCKLDDSLAGLLLGRE